MNKIKIDKTTLNKWRNQTGYIYDIVNKNMHKNAKLTGGEKEFIKTSCGEIHDTIKKMLGIID